MSRMDDLRLMAHSGIYPPSPRDKDDLIDILRADLARVTAERDEAQGANILNRNALNTERTLSDRLAGERNSWAETAQEAEARYAALAALAARVEKAAEYWEGVGGPVGKAVAQVLKTIIDD